MPPESAAPARDEKERLTLRAQIIDKVATLVTAAFGLVAALAWNNAIQAVFRRYYPSPEDALWGQLAYALVVTVVAVGVTLWVGRTAGRVEGRRARTT